MKKIIKIMALLALVCIVFASVFTALEVAHECLGDDCPVCAAINVFRHIAEAVFILTVCHAVWCCLSDAFDSINGEGTVRFFTPVSLKVKLSS